MTRYTQLKILSPLFWVLAFITSMMWAPAYEAEFFGAAFALLVISAVSADGLGIYKGYWQLPKGPVIYIGFAFWLVALLSIVFSDVPYVAYVFFFQFSLLPVAFLSFVLGHEANKRLKIAGWGLSAVTAALAIFAIAQYLMLPDWLQSGRSVAYPIKNPNGLASLLALGVFAGFSLALSTHRSGYVIIAIILATLSGLGIYTTGGRAVFIAMVAAFAIMIALLPSTTRSRQIRSLGVFAAIMGLGFFIFSIFAPDGADSDRAGPAAEAGMTIQKADKWLGSRPEIWRGTRQMIRDNPLTGTGIGTFFLYYPEYRLQGDPSSGYMAHSEPLQFWAELGIAGPVLFYAFLVAGLIRTWRAGRIGRTTTDPGQERAYIRMIVAFCGLGVVIVHAHVSYPLHISAILLAAGWHLAVWYHAGSSLLNTAYARLHIPAVLSPRQREGIIGMILGLGVFVILGALSPIVASEHYIHRAKRAAETGDVKAYARYVNMADKLGLGLNAKAYQMAATIPMGILESDKRLPADKVQKLFRQTQDLLGQALHYNPRLTQAYTYKARARMAMAERTGASPAPETQAFLRRALELNPKFLPAREALYQYYKSQGKTERAYKTLKAGMGWPYNRYDLRGYYRILSLEAIQNGALDLHARALKKLQGLRDSNRTKHGEDGLNTLQDSWQGLEGP